MGGDVMSAFIVKGVDENGKLFIYYAIGISAEVEQKARDRHNALGLSVILL